MAITNKDFWVKCNVCKQLLMNWSGSTPCCGSIAYLVEDGIETKRLSLYTLTENKSISDTSLTIILEALNSSLNYGKKLMIDTDEDDVNLGLELWRKTEAIKVAIEEIKKL